MATTHTPHTSDQGAADKVRELIADERLGMLTTIDAEGKLTSRPMALQRQEDDGTLLFLTDSTTPKADHLERDRRVNVAFQSNGTWISVAGNGYLDPDRALVRDLWDAGADAWFPDGPDSPDAVVLRVYPSSAEYWDTPGSRVASVLAYAKSRITGERPDIGESQVVDF
ncbi:MAG: pyridoxamine 5'-phosphate oxidase family protein [Solirubrobacteraceae bacterium]|nr:pyridoxamine 5'-phosphate oxidase family protein [Solirubrobacteraceae bacterium]